MGHFGIQSVHWSFILLKCLLKAALHTQLVLLCEQSEEGEGRVIATLNAVATFKVLHHCYLAVQLHKVAQVAPEEACIISAF